MWQESIWDVTGVNMRPRAWPTKCNLWFLELYAYIFISEEATANLVTAFSSLLNWIWSVRVWISIATDTCKSWAHPGNQKPEQFVALRAMQCNSGRQSLLHLFLLQAFYWEHSNSFGIHASGHIKHCEECSWCTLALLNYIITLCSVIVYYVNVTRCALLYTGLQFWQYFLLIKLVLYSTSWRLGPSLFHSTYMS